MTSQEPTYLSQGVNYLGFIVQQLGDLRGKTTLAHELIQNADDAKDDSGRLSATRIAFDVTDDALSVSNDAVFRETDFERMRELAGGSKRAEAGDRTTGAFGVGFISVYQVTDRPEIHSAGRCWTLRPDYPEEQRIEERRDPSITQDQGTRFKLPWAFQETSVRQELRTPPVNLEYVKSFAEELGQALPRAILFLKNLQSIELFRKGKLVARVTKDADGDDILVACDDESNLWRILKGDFPAEGSKLKDEFRSVIDENRSDLVQVAIPEFLIDDGLLYATLPTEQSTSLPFHINADFFPATDRKSIAFGDSLDARSEWNRAAIRTAAGIISANLLPIRDTFETNPSTFWAILDRLHSIHRDSGVHQRMPLGVFWELLAPSLGSAPTVYTEFAQWLAPAETRIPTGEKEQKAAPVFSSLGISMVHRDLWRYRNVLTNNEIGVRRLTAEDIYVALRDKGLVDLPQAVPSEIRPREAIELLWQGIQGVLDNTQQQAARLRMESVLRRCALAPGIDGRLWPCGSAFQADEATRNNFIALLPDDASFLAEEGIPLLEQLCPRFTPEAAIAMLECVDSADLQASSDRGEFESAGLLHWFDGNKSGLNDDLRERLARLPVFPSAKNLHPLQDLWLPGGFDDPMGVTDLLDMGALVGLSDFLTSLGARELTFEEYAFRYIAEAFTDASTLNIETKHKHLENLQWHIGEIKDKQGLRDKLSATNIVECSDGKFRQPGKVYFPSEEIERVLGDHATYASLPEESEGRRDLYHWLGVKTRPHVDDILRIIEQVTAKPPVQEARPIIVKMLEALWRAWENLSGNEKLRIVSSLRVKEWLPAEGDSRKWYQAQELYASYNKNLFESQAKFIDVPVPIQQRISEFLTYLQVKASPDPSLVVRHLVRCSKLNQPPPRGVYRWLNDNAPAAEIRPLQEVASLWVGDRYLRPSQVFWGSHSFGRFRVQLGTDLRSHQNLLQSLGIREAPEFRDAIEVLKEVSRESGTHQLQPEDQDVVLQCWVMLSEALQRGELDAGILENSLHDTPSVTNNDGLLQRPSWMFFEGRPGLAEKFPGQLKDNCIPRRERVWTAMEAAGVRTLSTVVQGHIDKALNQRQEEEIGKRIAQRSQLTGTILEGVAHRRQSGGDILSLDDLRFYCTDELTVTWELRAFDRTWPHTYPEPVQAHLDVDARAIYFTLQPNGHYPWSSIARELAFAVAPDEVIGSISPGLRTVLEAPTFEHAIGQAQELGIAPVLGLGNLSSRGDMVEPFDDEQTDESSQNLLANSNSGSAYVDDAPNVLPSPPDNQQQNVPDIPFAKRLYEIQTITSSRAAQRQVWLPPEGPLTGESARKDTEESIRIGRSGSEVSKAVTRWEPFEAANNLADRFGTMVRSDYGQRCQICSSSFTMTGGQFQVYVVHVVRPSADHRTNHFGDLLGLCGWHYALVRYGQWAFLDPETDWPFEDSEESEGWERMRDCVSNAPQLIDEFGNNYVGLKIRFWNVYQKRDSDPDTIEEEVRYSIPHWKYLCELLQV